MEQKVYSSDRKKISLNIGLLILLHLLSSATTIFFFLKVSRLLQNLSAVDRTGDIISAIQVYPWVGILLWLTAAAAGWIISLMLYHYAAKPLYRINAVFSELNTDDADLSKDVPNLGYGEFENLFSGYNRFLKNLREIVEKIRTMGIKIAIDSTKLARKICQTTDKSGEQADFSKLVTAASSDANLAIAEISENTQYVSDQTSCNLEKAKKAFSGLSDGAANIRKITEKVEAFKLTVEDLGRKSRPSTSLQMKYPRICKLREPPPTA